MANRVLIPLPGVGTLELTREVYEAALRPIEPCRRLQNVPAPGQEMVTAKVLAAQLSLPVSCLYEYAKAKRIPSVRVGKHVRFDPAAVLAALQKTGVVTEGHAQAHEIAAEKMPATATATANYPGGSLMTRGVSTTLPTELPARFERLFAWQLDRRCKAVREVAGDLFELWQAAREARRGASARRARTQGRP